MQGTLPLAFSPTLTMGGKHILPATTSDVTMLDCRFAFSLAMQGRHRVPEAAGRRRYRAKISRVMSLSVRLLNHSWNV